MNSLTKDEVILQLANLASGIERTTGDSLKAKALREAISFLDDGNKDLTARISDLTEGRDFWKRRSEALEAHVYQIEKAIDGVRSLSSATHTKKDSPLMEQRSKWKSLNDALQQSTKVSLKDHDRETAYNAIMWSVSELSKPEQDIVSAMAVEYINDKWPLDDSGKGG